MPRHSRRAGVFERAIAPIFLVRYYRCADCGDRYSAVGFGERRLVIPPKATHVVRVAAIVLLVAGLVAGAIAVMVLR